VGAKDFARKLRIALLPPSNFPGRVYVASHTQNKRMGVRVAWLLTVGTTPLRTPSLLLILLHPGVQADSWEQRPRRTTEPLGHRWGGDDEGRGHHSLPSCDATEAKHLEANHSEPTWGIYPLAAAPVSLGSGMHVFLSCPISAAAYRANRGHSTTGAAAVAGEVQEANLAAPLVARVRRECCGNALKRHRLQVRD
jgi:hypothetical protein